MTNAIVQAVGGTLVLLALLGAFPFQDMVLLAVAGYAVSKKFEIG